MGFLVFEMKATIEVVFDSAVLAEKALRVVGEVDVKKATVHSKVVGKKVVFLVESDSFAGLRALSTTVFRDVKVFLDSVAIVGKKKP